MKRPREGGGGTMLSASAHLTARRRGTGRGERIFYPTLSLSVETSGRLRLLWHTRWSAARAHAIMTALLVTLKFPCIRVVPELLFFFCFKFRTFFRTLTTIVDCFCSFPVCRPHVEFWENSSSRGIADSSSLKRTKQTGDYLKKKSENGTIKSFLNARRPHRPRNWEPDGLQQPGPPGVAP